jgi:thymidylate synthase
MAHHARAPGPKHGGYTDFDRAYARLVIDIARTGREKPSRQKMDGPKGPQSLTAVSLTAAQIRVPIGNLFVRSGRFEVENFPNLMSKYIPLGPVFAELAWFLRGETNSKDLEARGCKIWKDDADKAAERGFDGLDPGGLGPIYGHQWRKRPGGDQIERAVSALMADPFSRRNVVSSWDADRICEMVLPPCHFAFQFVCTPTTMFSAECTSTSITVDCVVYMRSTDIGLGLPFNVLSYAMLTILCLLEAEVRGRDKACAQDDRTPNWKLYQPGEVIVSMGDCHIYKPHLDPLVELAKRVLEAPVMEKTQFDLNLPEHLATPDTFANAPPEEFAKISGADWPAPRVKLPLFT